MKKLFTGLSTLAKPLGHIIHVGAGQCSELQTYQNLDPQKIILIEADNQQATQLKNANQSQQNIDILAYAIVDKKQQQTLKILTNQRDSSVLMPEKILDYYPSLEIVQEQSVETETLEGILQHYSLDKNYHHVLILEVQGLESQIIQSVSVDKLRYFSGIIIRGGSEQLYGQEKSESVIDLLEFIGFDYSYQENELYSSVFKKLYFQRNDEKIELMQSMQNIKQLTKENQALQELVTEQNYNIEKLTSETKNKITQLTQAKEEQTTLAIERFQILIEERDRQTKIISENQYQIEQLKKQQSELKNNIERFESKENQLQEELESAKQMARLSVKLQVLKEADLKDLQQRYQTALITQENQHKLLTKLHERLSLASGYFQQISQNQIFEQDTVMSKKNTDQSGLFKLFSSRSSFNHEEKIRSFLGNFKKRKPEKYQDEDTTLLIRSLKGKFGVNDQWIQIENKLQQLSSQQLKQLADQLLDFTDISELNRWLQLHNIEYL